MNKKLTDFDETREIVIQYHKEVRHKPLRFKVKEEENLLLYAFF